MLLFFVSIPLIQRLIHVHQLYRWQSSVFLFGVFAPWLGSAHDLFGWNLVPHLKLTPLAFTVTSLTVAWNLFYLRLGDIVPVAREVIVEGMSDGVLVLDAQNRIIDLNPAAQRLFGRSAAEAIGQPVQQLWPDWPSQMEYLDPGTEAVKEVMLENEDGPRTYDVRLSPRLDWRGQLISWVVVLRDVTERQRAEAERQVIFEIMHGVNVTANLDELFRLIHQSLKKVLDAENCFIALYDRNAGMFTEPFSSDQFDTAVEPQDMEKSCTAYVFRTGRPQLITEERFHQLVEQGEVELVGTPSPCWLGVPLKTPSETIGVLAVQHYEEANAYTERHVEFLASVGSQLALAIERKRAEAALRESQERYRDLVQGLDAIVWEADAATLQFSFVSQQAEAILGYPVEQWLTEPDFWINHLHPDDRERAVCSFQAATAEGKDHQIEYQFVAAHGHPVWLRDIVRVVRDDQGRVCQLRGLMINITQQKRMEEELLRAQKLESVGLLAGGIAHDFNNLLMGIIGNVSLAKTCAQPGDLIYERLTVAENAGLRARDLTQQLLTFSRGGAPIKTTASIAELLRETAAFALRGSDVRCELSLPDELRPVKVDQGQISQVINNLIINADQAMPDGGIIHVRAENVILGADQGLPLPAGSYVKISIEDQGTGIAEKHLPKIFDPYFTTKQKGSGLGLATAYSIIRKHEGYIAAESELGVGTTFTIYLPASEKEPPRVKQQEERPLNGHGKVLVMDDEDIIRDVTGQILRHLGYKVEFARDGAEAVKLYRKAQEGGEPFDVVIMDLTVPGGMGGKEALERLLEIDPQVKAIVSSGYSTDPIMAEFRRNGFQGCVAKPYKLQDLSQILQSVLNGS